jgi:uncharacterized membrane protein YqjE
MAQPIGSEDPRQMSLGELMKQLADQTSRLVRNEVRLARAELTEKARSYGRVAGMLGAAAVLGLLAGIAFTMFLIYLLKLALPLWAAALIVTVVYGVVGFALLAAGKKKLDEVRTPVPERTVESVKEDVQWLRTQTRSDVR